ITALRDLDEQQFWNFGIPGLPSLGPFDPLKVKRVVIAEDGNGPVSVNMVFTNMVLTGLTGAVLDDVNLNPTKSVMKLQIKLPKVNVKSEYDVKGRVLSLPLIGSGKALVDIGNLKAELALRYKLREEGGLTFADIEKIRVDFKDAAEFRLTLDNPQSEQTVLEEATNSAVNENWREYFEVMRPSITETVESIMGDRLQKMFSYIPATYFIEDIGVST
ncbi:protein takeout-like, partial [Stomoxys calcitrans]|uniref:protein takeout-like n=1 Tax=Stomoxys calcitrans TaxID=35570 RepID=UPI0027E3838D